MIHNPPAIPGHEYPLPFGLRRMSDGEPEKIQVRQEEEDAGKDRGKPIRCGVCRNPVTTSAHRMNVNGHHRHVFNNPSGHIFEIGCFSAADGCVAQGIPTFEFTWFAGFTWRLALCSRCLSHLGWQYQSAGGNSFYGLILANLAEET